MSDFRLDNRVVWEGCFSSFELALSAAKSLSSMEASLFSDKDWIRQHALATKTTSSTFVGPVTRSTNLPIFSSALHANHFVDFGGGVGLAMQNTLAIWGEC